MKSCIIIGGGVSGLAAAVDLVSSGTAVTLLEQRRHLGGRVFSFVDPRTGDSIDNGQHLMLGCYGRTFDYLLTIGTFDNIIIEPALKVPFRHPTRGSFVLDCPPLRAPFHLLAGLSRLKSISVMDRLNIIRVVPDLIAREDTLEQKLGHLTVDEWLNRCGQSERVKESLWNLIAIATLNDSPKLVSAKIFLDVLRTAFLHRTTDSSFVFSKVGLSELFVDGAVRFLGDHGATILTGNEVERLEMRDGRITGVRCLSGEEFFAETVVSSVPYYALKKILDHSGTVDDSLADALTRFTSSPILSLHLWFDRRVMEERFVGLLGTSVHWVFNKSDLYGKPVITSQYLTLVISGAEEYIDLPNESIIERAVEEMRSVFPAVKNGRLLRAKVIKERRATFSPRCGIDRYRPSSHTAIPNFFLAGDWTATGLPATIEGAIRSGYSAAKEVKESKREIKI